MIDGYEIMNTVKAWLDADADLNAALGTKQDSSKVQLGGALPDVSGMPLILLPDIVFTPNSLGQGRSGGQVQIDVLINAAAVNGQEDLETLWHICGHVDSLMQTTINGTYANITGLTLQPVQAATVDGAYCRKILTYTANAREK